MSILENGSIVTWPKNAKAGWISWPKVRQAFQREVTGLKIKMDGEERLIGSLSGGNQQKVVLAKWLNAGPKVLIFDNPTQGVDVGAKEDILRHHPGPGPSGHGGGGAFQRSPGDHPHLRQGGGHVPRLGAGGTSRG